LLFFAGCLALTTYSCQNSSFTNSNGSFNAKELLNLPGDIEFLGKGYDIYGKCARPTALKFSLFDFTQNIEEGVKNV